MSTRSVIHSSLAREAEKRTRRAEAQDVPEIKRARALDERASGDWRAADSKLVEVVDDGWL
ncbi:hypothetical protein [Halolamina salifodinae]|uniref:Uncharacterized protein n=1 Tax=Halolamina salifodinae TaxID=1202767 RepID=A0A8T4GX48_9EURY|nr:hypothetical protein [Halolamina salifodinae]MBP1985895.1 hypothetical protein [Halolamina salifodinae]